MLGKKKKSQKAHKAKLSKTQSFLFRFIVPDTGGDDVFVHVQDVQSFEMLPAGTQVSYTISTKKGLRPQAVRVIPLCPLPPRFPVPIVMPDPYRLPLPLPPEPQTMSIGVIKWYNAEKGFGFILSATGGGDIYFNTADVISGPPALVQNEEVVFAKVMRRNNQAARAINVSRLVNNRYSYHATPAPYPPGFPWPPFPHRPY